MYTNGMLNEKINQLLTIHLPAITAKLAYTLA